MKDTRPLVWVTFHQVHPNDGAVSVAGPSSWALHCMPCRRSLPWGTVVGSGLCAAEGIPGLFASLSCRGLLCFQRSRRTVVFLFVCQLYANCSKARRSQKALAFVTDILWKSFEHSYWLAYSYLTRCDMKLVTLCHGSLLFLPLTS